jgi:hypothetical protein
MSTQLFRYVPCHLLEDYLSQGWTFIAPYRQFGNEQTSFIVKAPKIVDEVEKNYLTGGDWQPTISPINPGVPE